MTPNRRALRATLTYLVLGGLWVLLSDLGLDFLDLSEPVLVQIQLLKGGLYVLVTGTLLFWLARRELRRQEQLNDLTQQRERELTALFRSVFEQAAVGMARVAPEGRWLQANARLCQILGYRETELCQRNWQSLSHPDDIQEDLARMARLLAGEIREFSLEKRYFRKNGEMFWGSLTVSAGWPPGEAPTFYIAIIQDISERRQVEAALRHSREMLARTERIANVGSWEWDINADRVIWSEELFRIFQRDPTRGAPSYAEHPTVYGPEDFRRIDACVAAAVRDGTPFELELKVHRPSGEIRHAISRGHAQRDGSGRITHLFGSFHDVTALRESEARLQQLAHHDTLTGLPNRVLFQQRVEAAIHMARDSDRFALLFLDLDRFKQVNDTLGHQVGDRLLGQVADALLRRIRDNDTLARFGGDEFVVLMAGSPAPETVERLACQLLEVFNRPFHLIGREFYLTGSIGISLYPRDGQDLDMLLRNADIAMYRSKEQTRNGYRFFEPAMLDGVVEHLRLENALRGALHRGELMVHYQPQLSLGDSRLQGAEALLRWRHPELGPISPGVFIPIAEEIGIIGEIGVWVLEQACRQLLAWDAMGLRLPRLAVNLSVQQLEDDYLALRIGEVLRSLGVDPRRLELEVTESMLMRSAESARANLTALRKMGVSVAIDDFGTGYSSLGYLKHLPINQLKIDRTFIEQVTVDGGDGAIVRAVIALARSLGLRVLAEGVETAEQASFLRAEGCHEAQGYYFGRPVPAAEFAAGWKQSSVS